MSCACVISVHVFCVCVNIFVCAWFAHESKTADDRGKKKSVEAKKKMVCALRVCVCACVCGTVDARDSTRNCA